MEQDLASYLELREEEARRQWRRIAAREPRPRQEPFLLIEVLLCYALLFLVDPHRFGGSNIDCISAEVKALARTLRRSPGSLTNKMLNLDGLRAPGDLEHRFRSKPSTDSGASRAAVPEQAEHRFRSKPSGCSGHAERLFRSKPSTP
jgi:hypothetical protein